MAKKAGAVALIFILVAIILFAGISIYNEVMRRNRSKEIYENTVLSNDVSSTQSDIVPGENALSNSEAFIKSQIDFEAEREKFEDIVGYIKLENAGVDYPIVQGEDNSFYLEHLANGEKNIYGSIFLDYRCNSDFFSEVSVIYGHDASNGTMFGSLEKYENKEFYHENKSYRIFTPKGDFDVEIFGGYLLDGVTGQYPGGFETEKDFFKFIAEVKEKSLFESDVNISFGDRLIILSTCSSRFDDARLAIVGKVKSEE